MPSPVVVTGGIYWVADHVLSLPPNEGRTYHPQRMVVVLSGPEINSDARWLSVLVGPMSSQSTLKTKFCVKLAAAESNVSKKCWIRVPAIQPILKEQLGDRVGTLTQERLKEVHARLLQHMGTFDE